MSCRTPVGFSVTTNATLLERADLELVATARVLGVGQPGRHGGIATIGSTGNATGAAASSSSRAIEAVRPLLDDPGSARVAARVTVPRDDLRVLERVEALFVAGFREVGVSPLRKSAEQELELRGGDWPRFLAEMVPRGRGRAWTACVRAARGGSRTWRSRSKSCIGAHAGRCPAVLPMAMSR